jgi:pimeloyl-ACP methyl ester carboxylesterase
MSVIADEAAPPVIAGVHVDMITRGQGRPILFLHPGIGIERDAAVLDRLAAHGRVMAPSHPGFGASELPADFGTIDDLAYFYLDLLEELDLRDVALVGVSFGGWIAAEVAIKSTARISHLALANPLGIKVGDRETRDIVDIFAITDEQFDQLAYCDPKIARRDYKSMPEDQVRLVARNREALARFGWSPYMHDPKLKSRLRRIDVPTLILWGEHDRIVSEPYGRAYAAAIPGARFEPMALAGHFPHLEQPAEFARHVAAFIEGAAR